MNCDQVEQDLIAYLKNELDAGKKKRLEEHLARCQTCRRKLEEARRVLEWTEAASNEAIIKRVDELLEGGIKAGASDIHIEPQKDDTLKVRYRTDGVLQEVATIEPEQRNGIRTRLKLLADLSISEYGLPQDGRIPFTLDGKKFDLRISGIPFIYGEGFVLRILDQSSVLIGLDKLGLLDQQLQALEHLLYQPMGLMLITGPTGSGKTTTAYSMLLKITSPEKKVLTVEDPVEYAVPGVNQVGVYKSVGRTFTATLRSFLRHDPDVIFSGEMRDTDTAAICLEAALTGHMVISTFHTDDAIGAIDRLRDMQIKPYLITASLVGVIAQRLVRKVCQSCKKRVEVTSDDPMLRALGITQEDLKNHNIQRGEGCENCRNTGYRGRTGVFEVLSIDRDLAAMIADGATTFELTEAAKAKGFVTMMEAGKQLVIQGITTPEEVFRALV